MFFGVFFFGGGGLLSLVICVFPKVGSASVLPVLKGKFTMKNGKSGSTSGEMGNI